MSDSGEGEIMPGAAFGPPPPRPAEDKARVFGREPPAADGAPLGPFSANASYPGYQTSGTFAGYGYGYAGPPKTDKGARHALILALVGIPGSLLLCGIVLGPAAVIEGIKAHKRISAANGRLTGDAMAIAGIAIGALVVAFNVFSIVLAIVASTATPTSQLR